ncbi:autotransporter outer membrane beta-barrel domain-containing protein, partial [Frateuria aurantia]
ISATDAGASLTTLSGDGAVTLGSQTLTLTDAAGEFSGVISGSGGVTVAGGTETLSGANTYTGTTTVDSGAGLVLSGSVAGDVDNSGSLSLDGGTVSGSVADGGSLNVTSSGGSVGSLSGAGSTTLSGDLTLTDASGTYSGVISGAGELIVSGGTETLTGASSFSGGTKIAGGQINIGNAEALGTGTLTMANGTTLGFVADDLDVSNAIALSGNGDPTIDTGSYDETLSGVISGSGALSKTGTGTLTLTANSTYTGGTTVSEGTLQLGNGGTTGWVTGDITIDSAGSLVFNRSDDVTYTGSLSGSGSIVKKSDDILTLSGDSSDFDGDTEIADGTLDITGSLGGNLVMDDGTVLTGTGTVGNTTLLSGSTISPAGDATMGTLSVHGDLTIDQGSTYIVNTNATGSADLISVTGTATINGGEVEDISANGTWAQNTRYTIVTASGGVSGTFDGVTSNFAFLTPSLEYDADNVYLYLSRNDTSFASVGGTYNERNTGAGLQSVGGGTVYDAVTGMSTGQARAAFDQLSGEIHANTETAILNDSRYVRDTVANHLALYPDCSDGQARQPSTTNGRDLQACNGHGSAWASTWGHWGSMAGDGNAARTTNAGGGVIVGADARVGDHSVLGVMVGHSEETVGTAQRDSTAQVLSNHLGIYGSTAWGGFQLRAGLLGSREEIVTHRQVSLSTISESLNADYHANLLQGFVEGAYRFSFSHGSVEPYVNLARVHLQTDGFQENGGDAALAGNSHTSTIDYGSAGVRGSWVLDARSGISLWGRLGYQQAWSGRVPTSSLRFSGGDDFSVAGVPVARRTGLADIGLEFKISPRTRVDAGYTGQFGSGIKDQGGRLNLTVSF